MKNKCDDLVSIIIPTYKRPNYLGNAIDSALNQTYQNIEIIVVDDNDPQSKERIETEQVMFKYKENKYVKYIKHIQNSNGSVARNTGILNSKGKYICFLDDDDEFKKDKVLKQVEKMESLDNSWGACYVQFDRIKSGKLYDKGIENEEGYLMKSILLGQLYISSGSNIMVRRDVIDEVGGFNPKLKRKQDLYFLCKIAEKYKIASIETNQLIINKYDGIKPKIDIESFKEMNDFYYIEFDNFISMLSDEDKNKLTQIKHLEYILYTILGKYKKEAIDAILSNKTDLLLLLKYLKYYITRKLKKQCYGFKY